MAYIVVLETGRYAMKKRTDVDTESPSILQGSFGSYVSQFTDQCLEDSRLKLEKELQEKIAHFEKGLAGAKQIRSKRFHTRLGTITLKRRAYPRDGKLVCLVDEQLGLPNESWLKEVDELACALGVTNDFAQAQTLFEKWTRVKVSDHGLSNRVEEIGERLYQQELSSSVEEMAPLDTALSRQVRKGVTKKRVYVGADGIMVPTRAKKKQAKHSTKKD
jgi:Uncharacterised protein family (UPF0236)